MSSRSQRTYLHSNNYLYRFPVEHSDLLSGANEEDRFNGSNSSGSLLLRNDAIGDVSSEYVQQTRRSSRKRRKRKKPCNTFNRFCLCLLGLLSVIGLVLYLSFWLVKINSIKCGAFVEKEEEGVIRNLSTYHWVSLTAMRHFVFLP